MNTNQRLLVIVALVVIGLVLAIVMLDWSDQYRFGATKVLVFYERPDAQYRNLTDEMGIYTRYGVAGIVLGVVAPLCLFAVAAFVALGVRRT
jgi:hypothetical protein